MNRLGLEAFIGMTKKEWDDEHMKEKRNSVGASIHAFSISSNHESDPGPGS